MSTTNPVTYDYKINAISKISKQLFFLNGLKKKTRKNEKKEEIILKKS